MKVRDWTTMASFEKGQWFRYKNGFSKKVYFRMTHKFHEYRTVFGKVRGLDNGKDRTWMISGDFSGLTPVTKKDSAILDKGKIPE